jgi:hypothetical protein
MIGFSREWSMRKYTVFTFLLLVVAALLSISCKSTPKVETQAKTPAAGVEEARKRAIDFESPSYFPSDWEELESRYAEAAYAGLEDSYNELFQKTIPLYAQAREDEITAVRDEIISAGFNDVYPDYLQTVDEMALKALEYYEAKDYYAAKDKAAEALNEYELLCSYSKVFLKRQEIIDRGFAGFDTENFEKADEVANVALAAYDAGDKKNAEANIEDARHRYNLVLANGWVAYASQRRASATAERERALSNKVNISARDSFREAETFYNQAGEALDSELYENAALLFIDAEARYLIAEQEADEKREKALETIRIAGAKIEESDETAIQAEKIIEGGSR